MTLDLRSLQVEVAEFRSIAKKRPLTLWRGWGDHDLDGVPVVQGARTTQRRVVQELQWARNVVALGGQRSGKTEALRAAGVALGLGSDHPDARSFWLANGCDPDLFPRGPGNRLKGGAGWFVARTSGDSIRYSRPQVLALTPKWGPPHAKAERGESWRALNLDGRGEARIEVMCPGYDLPAEFFFKSEDQKADGFDGDATRFVHHDEEGKTPAIWDQCKSRLTDYDGWHLFSNAPIKGRTWVYNRFEREVEPDTVVRRLWSKDNPYLPRKRAMLLDANPVKGRGEFVVTQGRIWPMFSRSVHVIPHRPWPLDWPRFRVIDFGLRHPHVCLWSVLTKARVVLGPDRVIPDRSLIIYREHYQPGWTLAQHVNRYRELEGWVRNEAGVWVRTPTTERFEATWADPEDPQQILSLNNDHGIETMYGNKARTAGEDAVATRLLPDRHGYPSLFVSEVCMETIREWEDYIEIDAVDREGNPTHKPSQRSDHTCDCGRYLVLGVNAYL